jgi:hypothetical protein
MKNPPSQNVPVHFVGSVSPLLVVLLALAALVYPSTATAETSFVRVHQTGYVANAPKRAYLMSSASSSGASFSVLIGRVAPRYLGPDRGS